MNEIKIKFFFLLFFFFSFCNFEKNKSNASIESEVNLDSLLKIPIERRLFLDFSSGVKSGEFKALFQHSKIIGKIDSEGYYPFYFFNKFDEKEQMIKTKIGTIFTEDLLSKITLKFELDSIDGDVVLPCDCMNPRDKIITNEIRVYGSSAKKEPTLSTDNFNEILGFYVKKFGKYKKNFEKNLCNEKKITFLWQLNNKQIHIEANEYFQCIYVYRKEFEKDGYTKSKINPLFTMPKYPRVDKYYHWVDDLIGYKNISISYIDNNYIKFLSEKEREENIQKESENKDYKDAMKKKELESQKKVEKTINDL